MKKCLFILIAFFSTLNTIAQSEKAIYIYRNDGDFNAFLCEDVDSLVHSNIGIDGVSYDQMVIQEVWTEDSIYRIPLAVIDSISFFAPEPIVNNKVKFMESDYLPYIQDVDGLTLRMKSGTPNEFVPQMGTILVSNCFEGVLENGFSGRVISCNQQGGFIVIECEEVGLTDVYDRLITVGKCESPNNDLETSGTRKRAYGTHNLDLGSFSASIGPVNFSDNPQVTFSWVAFIDRRLVVMEGSRYHPIIQLLFKHSHDLSLTIKSQVDGEYEPEPIWKIESPAVRIPQIPGLYARVRLGFFWSAHGSVNLDATLSGNLTFVNGFKWDEGGFKTINRMTNISFNMEGSIEGGVAARLVAGIGSERIASMDATLRLGPQLASNFSLTDKGLENGTLYSSLKDSKLSINAYGKLSAGYTTIGDRIMGSDHNRHDIPLTLSWDHIVHSWNILPEFSEIEVEKSMSDLSATIRCTPEKDILIPLGLGLGLYNEDGTLVDRLFNAQDYKREGEGYVIEQTFTSLEREKEYEVRPLIRIFGKEMGAVPTKAFIMEKFPVTITDFTVTDKQYQNGAFYHDGQYYDYRFDAATTVTLEDSEDVIDWGYVYKDPNGRTKEISLNSFGTSYTDTRYAYFRNGTPPFTCTLYGYVKYVGSGEPVYGDPHDYPLIYKDSSLFQFKDIRQGYSTFASGNVKTLMIAEYEVAPGYEDVDLSFYEEVGVYIKNKITGEEEYLPSDVYYVSNDMSIPKNYFEKDYTTFTATCDKFLCAIYTIDKNGKTTFYDEQTLKMVYNKKPSLTFTSASLGGTTPINDFYGGPGYRTLIEVNFNASGAFWVNIVKVVTVESLVEVDNSVSFRELADAEQVGFKYYLEYDSEVSNIDRFDLILDDGTIVPSTNAISYWGSPTITNIEVVSNANSRTNEAPKRITRKASSSHTSKQRYVIMKEE